MHELDNRGFPKYIFCFLGMETRNAQCIAFAYSNLYIVLEIHFYPLGEIKGTARGLEGPISYFKF